MSGLASDGYVHVRGPLATPGAAFTLARELLEDALGDERPAPLEVVGDFVLPPADGPPTRDFQLLHVDCGVPLVPAGTVDLAGHTALHVQAAVPSARAVTRLVPLAPLLRRRAWPPADELRRRFAAYGAGHAGRDGAGYVEGSLVRIVEAAAGGPPVLPRVEPAFLCGTELPGPPAERAFLAARGAAPDSVEIGVRLAPGDLLVFDNLRFAHGRRGVRQPGELRQRAYGHRGLGVEGQRRLRDRLLAAFAAPAPAEVA